MEKEELLEKLSPLMDERTRRAFRQVDRAKFVPEEMRKYAYVDEPLPIGEGQTISQPWTVAFMAQALNVEEGNKILEVGSGSGYQAAILSVLAGEKGRVVTTEIRPALYETARKNLAGYRNVLVIDADGSKGWEKEAPYDRIIVTAAATKVPEKLVGQLKDGGVMVIPVGNEMYKIEKKREIKKTFLGYFAFVPLKE